ncbi:amidase family protein [Vreelandella profundi]|uniref:amidase family protein n=1 Tax=Vreelandella profundi TaxID=2852117 RepID=UPI001EEF63A7|nr:amidase family protein [Halomonas profundi]
MAEAGASLLSTKLWQLLNVIDELRNQVDGLFTRTDVVLMPSIAALSWPADEPYPPMIDGQPVGPRGHAIFTGWVNAAGNPAISLPTGLSREGLPIGLQLIGPWQADHLLLALAARYQDDHPWQHNYRAIWQ